MDYFNETERSNQTKMALARDQALRPLIKYLAIKGVEPGAISFAGVIFLLCSLLARPGLGGAVLAAVLLLVYIAADVVDGPLARYLGQTSKQGSLIDMLADQLGVFLLPLAASYYGLMNSTVLFMFSGCYLFTIVLMVALNNFKIKYVLILRIKYFLFGSYVVALAGWAVILFYLVTMFSVYYFIVMLYLYGKLCFSNMPAE